MGFVCVCVCVYSIDIPVLDSLRWGQSLECGPSYQYEREGERKRAVAQTFHYPSSLKL